MCANRFIPVLKARSTAPPKSSRERVFCVIVRPAGKAGNFPERSTSVVNAPSGGVLFRMSGQTPAHKQPKLIVVMAFDRDENGDLQTVFGPAEQQSEERAIRNARIMAQSHAGVIAWSREANPALGEYGEPIVLFQSGEVPAME